MTRADLLTWLRGALQPMPRPVKFHRWWSAVEIADMCSLGCKPVGLMLSRLVKDGYVDEQRSKSGHAVRRYRLSQKGWLV